MDSRCPTLSATISRMNQKQQFMQSVNILAPSDQRSFHGAQLASQEEKLPINDAIQIKAAEYWLKLGEADQALRELEALRSRSWKCGWALKTRIAAIGALRERSEVQE